MLFIQGKCENCGGFLTVDPSLMIANCPYCGIPYIISNNLSPNTINANRESDFEIEAGVLKKYRGVSTDVIIPYGVTIIGEGAFQRLGITTVNIPKSVVRICNYAFRDCVNLKNVNLPDSITHIDENAFQGCITANITWPKYYFDKQLTKIRIAAHMLNRSIDYLPRNITMRFNSTISLLYDGEYEYLFCEYGYFKEYHVKENPVTNYNYCVSLDIQKVYDSLALLLDRASISRDVIKEVEIDCFGRDKGSIKNGKVKNLLFQINTN